MAQASNDPHDLIDLERYPLFDPEARDRIVAGARADMAATGSAILRGFVSGQGIATILSEALALAPAAHRRDNLLGAYPESVPETPDASHPVRRRSAYRMGVVATDQIDAEGPILAIYEWPPLIRLVADILEMPELHVVADPMMRCNFTFLGNGDEHGWHFDGNDFVVSLMIQQAASGGEFEFAPNIRGLDRPNYEGVRDVMDERPGCTRLIRAGPGTLILFRGRRSLHRVTRVQGHRLRVIALLSYHETPGLVNGPAAQRRVFNRAYGESVSAASG